MWICNRIVACRMKCAEINIGNRINIDIGYMIVEGKVTCKTSAPYILSICSRRSLPLYKLDNGDVYSPICIIGLCNRCIYYEQGVK